MNAVESVKLSEILKLVAKPTYVLGTTYTLSLAFFESVVFPCIDRSRLKSCLILCDEVGYQAALAEAGALLGAAQDYMVMRAPVRGSFHAKVWIIVGADELVLLAGSGNLTQAGFMSNAELFDVLHFKPGQAPGKRIIDEIRAFINGLVNMWPAEDRGRLLCSEILYEVDRAVSAFPVEEGTPEGGPRFLHSFHGALLDQLPLAQDARELYVAAPYFGGSLQGLKLLTARYPAAQLHLFPAIHGDRATDIPLEQAKKVARDTAVAQLVVPSKKSAFAHLKLYGIARGDKPGWLCCTSANCTLAAWNGPNIEAGILRPMERSRLIQYFNPGATTFPEGKLSYEAGISENALQCWAADTGGGLDLVVGSAAKERLPLQEVVITVRAGSEFYVCRKASMFSDGLSMHLPWAAFEGWRRRRKIAVWLQLRATDATGGSVTADCLVENSLLLRADPTHRSAWRGALALLDTEGAPELADVAAIFTLAADIFSGMPAQIPDAGGVSPVKTEQQEPPAVRAVAIWPPEPDAHGTRVKVGMSSLGQLQWFQHILKTFLQAGSTNDDEEPHDSVHDNSDVADDDDGGDEDERKSRGADDEQLPKTVLRIWERAQHDYERLRAKLTELCPTAENAPNVWPAAVFALLSTLAVLRSSRRLAVDSISEKEAEYLCDDFIRAMFMERKQHPDFCCPAGFRYRTERFPPLADDLLKTFSVRPHADLASVLLSLLTDRRLRSAMAVPPTPWQLKQAALTCGSMTPDAEVREASRRIWKRYVRDTSRQETDADFDKCFDALCNGLGQEFA